MSQGFMTQGVDLRKCRVAVLVSGRGSNLRALLEATRADDFPATIDLVVSDRESDGCVFAREVDIETCVIKIRATNDKKNFETKLDKLLRSRSIELVCLAGFMPILSPSFVDAWRARILNIHPSLLPKLRGLNTHKRAIEEGHTEHGCSVHIVTEKIDEGEILKQASLTIEAGESPEGLAERVLKLEHELYSQVLDSYARKIITRKIVKSVTSQEQLAELQSLEPLQAEPLPTSMVGRLY